MFLNISIIKFLDKYLGIMLILILKLFKRKKSSINNPKSILCIQLWSIGETILTLPAIKLLYQNNKNIDILTTSRAKDVFESFSSYKNLQIINLSFFSVLKFLFNNYNKYDIVIDMEEYLNISSIISFFAAKQSIGFSHGLRSILYDIKIKYNDKQHVSKTFMDLAKPLKLNKEFNSLEKLETSKNDKKIVDKFIKDLDLKSKFLVGIAPNVAESSKCRIWPIQNFSKIADFLIKEKKAEVIFVGGPQDNEIIKKTQNMMKNKSTNIAGKLTLKQTFYFIEKLNLFIGNDSGPMHIAAAQKTKTIGLFGPNIPIRFGPYGKNNISIYKGDNCQFSPCINVHKGQVPDCLYAKNSKEYQKCMKNIQVEDVIGSIKNLT